MDDIALGRARRALELGRLRTASIGAALVTLTLAVLSLGILGSVDPRWLALPFAAWTLVMWHGGAAARGAARGLALGVAGWLVPLSVLRPCCATMASVGASCCTRPECCLEAGALLGALVGLIAPFGEGRTRATERPGERLAGTLAIAGSALGVRCAGLFFGESLGLLAGLALGGLFVGGTRLWIARVRSA